MGEEMKLYHFEGNDPLSSLFATLQEIRPEVIETLFRNIPMHPLTEDQKAEYKITKHCYICSQRFTHENFPVRDHCHQSGDFIGKACRNCNLHRRISKQSKVAIVVDKMDECGHGIFRKIAQQDDKLRVEILSKNFNQYLSLQWGMWKFIDASHFMDFQSENVDDLMSKFENFRKLAYSQYGLDPAHYVSAPGLSWDAMLRHTKVKIELIDDVEKYEFIEKAIRGGFATMPTRYAKVEEPDDHIVLLDANNLYGYALSQPLPIGDYRWEEITEALKEVEGRSAFIEVDLEYPTFLEDHYDFPLIVNKELITKDMLGDYQRKLLDLTGEKISKDPKLTASFTPKYKYVIARPLLNYIVEKGVIITKIHKVLSFATSPFMKSYIGLNTLLRHESTNNFESDFFKLMNNAIYGKCLESCRGRSTVKIANSEKLCKKYAASPLIKATNVINENAVAFEMYSKHVNLDKPVAIGAFVLDFAKLHNYQFFYDVIRKKWDSAKLLFHDTDSFCLFLKTKNLNEDMKAIGEHLDRSNYDKSHPLMNIENRMVPGKYKNEFPNAKIVEYVGLRSKLYAFRTETNEKVKMSGTSSKEVHFDDFKKCLFEGITKTVTVRNKQRQDHNLYDLESRRVALNQLDSKRKIFDDGIHSFPFGV